MPNRKPFVQVASICEKVLLEKDGVVSLIRLVDTFYVSDVRPKGLPDNVTSGVQIAGFVSIKAGDVTGQHELSVKYRNPSGEIKDVGSWPVILNGGEHGANIVMNLMISATELGLAYFDVFFDGELLTSIPLRIARQVPQVLAPETYSP